MSFKDKLSAVLPFAKKEEVLEYFFALNISPENLTAALWQLEGKHLKILETATDTYSSLEDLGTVTDKLLDSVLGIREIDPQKILFGVPSTWLTDENLKDENLKILRKLVKELELTPMAYVESANAMVHLLEKTEGVPPTAILVGFEVHHLTVTVVRAGKLDGVKVVSRGDSSGADIEKALLNFTAVETLPSKILIYGTAVESLKSQLLSFPWMSKLSFLHFPKIDSLGEDIEIKGVCLAGASELQGDVIYTEHVISKTEVKQSLLPEEEKEDLKKHANVVEKEKEEVLSDDSGFMVGDVSEKADVKAEETSLEESDQVDEIMEEDTNLLINEDKAVAELDDFQENITPPISEPKKKLNLGKFVPKGSKTMVLIGGLVGVLLLIAGSVLVLPKAEIKIFVEPKIIDKDTQVIADPNQKEVDESAKVIPGKVVNTEVSGTGKETATGKKQIGDPAKGTVIVYNKTSEKQVISKGAVLASSAGLKFVLDSSVTIASQSASDSGITYGKSNGTVTASAVGADSNLASGSEFTVGSFSASQVSAKAEGNFSGGTSKSVTVVSSDDQSKLLASVGSNLRKQAQQKLQESQPEKKILEEALSEEIVKKTFNKNINDQASEFSLNLTAKYKGTAFEDKDLKLIVSKLVTTDVPSGFKLNLEDTETQADVSKLEKDGKLIFLARFKAKLMPEIDIEKVKNQLKGKTATQAEEIIKGMENVLGSEIKMSPSLPKLLQIIPILGNNITIEVGLK